MAQDFPLQVVCPLDHEQDEALAVSVGLIRTLFSYTGARPMLYVEVTDDDMLLDVFSGGEVAYHAIVLTRDDAWNLFGADPTDDDIREYLPVVQTRADEVVRALRGPV